MVRVSVAVLAVVVLCPFMVMVEIKKENHHLAQHARRGQWQSLDDYDGHNKTIHSKLWFGSWFVAGGWRGSGEAAAEHADGAVQQAGAAGLQRVPGSPAQVRADSAADHRRGECP